MNPSIAILEACDAIVWAQTSQLFHDDRAQYPKFSHRSAVVRRVLMMEMHMLDRKVSWTGEAERNGVDTSQREINNTGVPTGQQSSSGSSRQTGRH